jgi:aminoglycoside phosphotransferase (APT) family kinase protein
VTCTVPSLAGLDPDLPGLAAGTDPDYVRQLFATRPPRGAAPGTAVLGCERLHTEYEPGLRCRMSYRLQLGAPGAQPWSTFGGVLIRPTGLTMWWYADDPAIPTLGAAADPSSMRARMDSWADQPVRGCSVTPVRYRAGVRCLLRYEAATADGPRLFFGKLYGHDADRQARTQAALHAMLDAERRAGAACPAVAPLVGYESELGLLAHAPVAGTTLRALLFDASVDVTTRLRALYDTGGRLAGLHGSAGVPGPLLSLGDDLAELRGYGAAVARVDPALAERLADVTDLAGALPCGEGPLVPSHGALRTDQVFVGPDGIVLLDLDRVGWAEPARDVGNLLAYLAWRALRRPAERGFVSRARAAFLAGYRDRCPDLDEAQYRRQEAVALLKIAGRRFRALQYDEWPLVSDLVTLAGTTLAPGRRPSARHTPAMLSALASVTDPARMTAELRALPWEGDGAGGLTVHSAEVVAYRAERTAVVRYDLVDGRGRDDVLLGKLYREPGIAVRAHAVQSDLASALSGALSGATGGRAVPEPIGVLPSLGLLVYAPVHGRCLDEVLGDGASNGAAPAAARWLARLHGSSAGLDRRLDLDVEQTNVRAWAQTVERNLPDVARRADELAERLVDALGTLRVRLDVPIHKDFHYQHVLVGSRLAVIDLDEARMGDPSLDVAHFCVCLDLLALRGTARAAEAKEAFLRAYADHRGWVPDPAYDVFSAWTCLKIAKQLATGRGPRPRPVAVERLRQAQHMLSEGLSWLR